LQAVYEKGCATGKAKERSMEADLISIIIPVYNAEKYLWRCWSSILAQTYKNLEIIMVDDGSNDNSGKICDGYAKQDPRIIVIHKENGGPSSARNIGLNMATGDYIGFIDGDDWIEPDMFASMLRAMKKSGAKIARCGIVRNETYSILYMENKEPELFYNMMGLEEAAKSVWDNGFMCNKLFKSELFQEDPCIRFDERIKYVEDEPVFLDCLIRSGEMVDIDSVKYHYFVNADSMTGVAFRLDNISSMIGFEHMCNICQEHIPELVDLFKSKYYSICVGFLLYKETRKSKKHRKELSSELRNNLMEIIKLQNMTVKFKLAAVLFSFI
jgi:glycosyltransferase involved in cell wall biosynthesis